MDTGHRLFAGLWYGLAATLPGIALTVIDAGGIGDPLLFAVLFVVMPAACATLWGALLGHRLLSDCALGFDFWRSVRLGIAIPLLSILTWVAPAALMATMFSPYSAKFILVAAVIMATVGGVVVYPIGMTAGLVLRWLCLSDHRVG